MHHSASMSWYVWVVMIRHILTTHTPKYSETCSCIINSLLVFIAHHSELLLFSSHASKYIHVPISIKDKILTHCLSRAAGQSHRFMVQICTFNTLYFVMKLISKLLYPMWKTRFKYRISMLLRRQWLYIELLLLLLPTTATDLLAVYLT